MAIHLRAPSYLSAQSTTGKNECSISAREPQRIALPDGSRVVINVADMAVQENDVLTLAYDFYIFGSWGKGMDDRSAIGLVRTEMGESASISPPIESLKTQGLRAVAASRGGWHVIFATGTRDHAAYDSTDIWYGHYDGRRWTETEKLARTGTIERTLRSISNLMETDRGLAFAFLFSNSSNHQPNKAGDQGVVMLTKKASGWQQDSLRTATTPTSIQLATSGSKLQVLFSQPELTDREKRSASLFIVGYDSTWQTPEKVYGPASEQVYDVVVPVPGGVERGIAIRTTSQENSVDGGYLEWGKFNTDGVLERMVVSKILHRLSMPASAHISSSETVILVPGDVSSNHIGAFIVTPSGVKDLGALDVPVMNSVVAAAPLANGSVVMVTIGEDNEPDPEPPYFTTYFTEIEVQCTATTE